MGNPVRLVQHLDIILCYYGSDRIHTATNEHPVIYICVNIQQKMYSAPKKSVLKV
jgi:hypothetical protein